MPTDPDHGLSFNRIPVAEPPRCVEMHRMALSPKDLDFGPIRDEVAMTILRATGIPRNFMPDGETVTGEVQDG